MSVFERLMQPENFNYAWLKAKRLYQAADGYVDTAEFSAFEIELEKNLIDIREYFERGSYAPRKLRALPRPKKISDGQPINRQYYHVPIKDQVAWIALVNAIGPELDQKMEPWSYGNRLYRPAWYETDETGGSKLEIGPYRHAGGHLYRRFQHSWPLFRRHVTLTARMMARRGELNFEDLDRPDQLAATTAKHEKLIYFNDLHWQLNAAPSKASELFHASIDLEKFYPSLKKEAVVAGLGWAGALNDARIESLVQSMMNFRLDLEGMPEAALENVEPEFLKTRFHGIPTGLFVSGFLANAAMLPVDEAVANELAKRRDIAHFRFVDDHTILSFSFEGLCDWVDWYWELIQSLGIGPGINIEKSDPPEFGAWIKSKVSNETTRKALEAVDQAKRETRFDGKNPVKLMTKTLAQVSAIATADIHIMDDDDLDERLRMLEWLLLADIPEREIRSDTRASFAAGQIASLALVRLSEVDGIVEAHRDLAQHERRKPDPNRSTEEERASHHTKLAALIDELKLLMAKQDSFEIAELKRCFNLLLQSLREHPGKARLFYRTHDYCRRTGHKGLGAISDWINDLRSESGNSWGDYYAGLSLQILAKGLPATVTKLLSDGALQSEKKAAESHLGDISELKEEVFKIPKSRATWFHAGALNEFGIALFQVAECLREVEDLRPLASRLLGKSQLFVSISSNATPQEWRSTTGWPAGVWAHSAEDILATQNSPSPAWLTVSNSFGFENELDLKAARRYPTYLPDAGWQQILNSKNAMPEDDSAWLREAIGSNKDRIRDAQASSKKVVARAARSLRATSANWISVNEWTQKLVHGSPFDPRNSEWTALEIVRQILEQAISVSGDLDALDRLHPDNVLLPGKWLTDFELQRDNAPLGWEEWRECVRGTNSASVTLRKSGSCLWDYRISGRGDGGLQISLDERRLVSIGRLLLGILRRDHGAPNIWNIRGNEKILRLPRSRWFRELAISSPTTQILEACLAARPAESRVIAVQPGLFAVQLGVPLNDVGFDPEPIFDLNDLVEGLQSAQDILQSSQIAVSAKQPRQLIPFRLIDFSAAADDDEATGQDEGAAND